MKVAPQDAPYLNLAGACGQCGGVRLRYSREAARYVCKACAWPEPPTAMEIEQARSRAHPVEPYILARETRSMDVENKDIWRWLLAHGDGTIPRGG